MRADDAQLLTHSTAKMGQDPGQDLKGDYVHVGDTEQHLLGSYDKPLPCFGCGIGWFSFLLGFVFPLMWYYGTFLYFRNYYRRDPRERTGLATCAIAALVFTIAVIVILPAILL